MIEEIKKVILADDDVPTTELLRMALEEAGFEVEIFNNGREAWERLLGQHEPALVIMDWIMPEIPGIEICRSITGLGLHQHLYVLMISGLSEPEQVVEALDAGADDYIRKPIYIPELLAKMRVASRRMGRMAMLEKRVADMTAAQHGRYEMKGLIGKGGLGEVFEGWDNLLGRSVAIKRFRPLVKPDSDAQEEMKREARIMASLNHPNLTTIYDCWDSPMGTFVVMELLRGVDLDKIVDESPLAAPLFQKLCEHLLSGLDAAYRAGILHCDLKPSNIMIVGDPLKDMDDILVKILDFGVARLVSEVRELHTHESAFVEGSLYFIAPEILASEPIDVRSDLYSVGHILFYALTGKHGVQGNSIEEVIEAHLQGGNYRLADMRPDLPMRICAWVENLMSRQPSERPTTPHEALNTFRTLFPHRSN